MLFLVIVLALGAVVAGLGSAYLGSGRRRFDDVERFHVARSITTEWARNGVTAPVLVREDEPADERERVDA